MQEISYLCRVVAIITPMMKLLLILFLLISIGEDCLAQQRGKATFYAKRMNGHKTASGERLYNDSLVCAHKTHKFGTLLKVVNPANGKEVIVKVIDRGPYAKGRIIDLSIRAARELGILSQGVAMVEVSVYRKPTEVPYKPEDYDLPEIEIEATTGETIIPQWQDSVVVGDSKKKK